MARASFLPFSLPGIGDEEIEAVTAVLRSGWITTGPVAARFEERIAARLGGGFCLATSSGTAALHLALLALHLKPGDEVICPSLTWPATANTIVLAGGKPVFADVRAHDLNIDPEDVARKVTRRTRALLPVHFAGAPCDMAALEALARRHRLAMVQDAAHALGTLCGGREVGARGDVACYSFHPTKNVTTAEGGALWTKDARIADVARLQRFHGVRTTAWERTGGPAGGPERSEGRLPKRCAGRQESDVRGPAGGPARSAGRLRHAAGRQKSDVLGGVSKTTRGYDVEVPGLKYNLSDLHAALGVAQLEKLDGFLSARERLADLYRKRLSGIDLLEIPAPRLAAGDRHAWHIFPVLPRIDALTIDRFEIQERLRDENIGTGLHFLPVHRTRFYRKLLGRARLPVTERAGERILSLPLFPRMTESDVEDVAAALEKVLSVARRPAPAPGKPRAAAARRAPAPKRRAR